MGSPGSTVCIRTSCSRVCPSQTGCDRINQLHCGTSTGCSFLPGMSTCCSVGYLLWHGLSRRLQRNLCSSTFPSFFWHRCLQGCCTFPSQSSLPCGEESMCPFCTVHSQRHLSLVCWAQLCPVVGPLWSQLEPAAPSTGQPLALNSETTPAAFPANTLPCTPNARVTVK